MTINNTTPEPRGDTLANDEIDLFDLLDDLTANWIWLAASVVLFLLAALAYALLATPTYQTEVVYKPVKESDLLQLNQPRLKDVLGFNDTYLTPKQAFANLRSEALSSNTLREFYDQQLETQTPQQLELIHNPQMTTEQNTLKFIERFSHVDPSTKETDAFLRLKFNVSDALFATQVLNQYSDYVLSKNKDRMQESVTLQIQAQFEQWQMQADQLRTQYFAKKKQRLAELTEAVSIAQKINQQNPVYGAERFAIGSQPPLYMMGVKALSAEIEALNNRADVEQEEAYITGLAEVLWKIKTAESVNINWHSLRFVEQDQNAVIPLSAIQPKKKLIVVIGAVAGFMFGAVLAIAVAAWKRRQQIKLTEQTV